MELILLIGFVGLLIAVGLIKLIESTHIEEPVVAKSQQMLFMSAALDVNDELTRSLSHKMDIRSLEIAKADGRFLVTPEDMRRAYNEIIREEHM